MYYNLFAFISAGFYPNTAMAAAVSLFSAKKLD